MARNDQSARTSTTAGRKADDLSVSTAQHHSLLPPLKKKDFDRASKVLINVSVAAEALWANRLRSLLTTLGIFIGVSAVVSMVSLIQGISANWTDTISSLGSNMIIIAPGTGNNVSNSGISSNGGVSVSIRVTSTLPAAETTLSLTPGDATAVAKTPDVTAVSPIIFIHGQIISGNRNWNTRIAGVDTSREPGRWSCLVRPSISNYLPLQARTRLAKLSVLAISSSAWWGSLQRKGGQPLPMMWSSCPFRSPWSGSRITAMLIKL